MWNYLSAKIMTSDRFFSFCLPWIQKRKKNENEIRTRRLLFARLWAIKYFFFFSFVLKEIYGRFVVFDWLCLPLCMFVYSFLGGIGQWL